MCLSVFFSQHFLDCGIYNFVSFFNSWCTGLLPLLLHYRLQEFVYPCKVGFYFYYLFFFYVFYLCAISWTLGWQLMHFCVFFKGHGQPLFSTVNLLFAVYLILIDLRQFVYIFLLYLMYWVVVIWMVMSFNVSVLFCTCSLILWKAGSALTFSLLLWWDCTGDTL